MLSLRTECSCRVIVRVCTDDRWGRMGTTSRKYLFHLKRTTCCKENQIVTGNCHFGDDFTKLRNLGILPEVRGWQNLLWRSNLDFFEWRIVKSSNPEVVIHKRKQQWAVINGPFIWGNMHFIIRKDYMRRHAEIRQNLTDWVSRQSLKLRTCHLLFHQEMRNTKANRENPVIYVSLWIFRFCHKQKSTI